MTDGHRSIAIANASRFFIGGYPRSTDYTDYTDFKSISEFMRMAMVDPPATAGGTDPVQVQTVELVFYKLELQTHTALGAVEERPELLAGEIVLHVTRVPVIRDVEDRKARTAFVLLAMKRNR